MPIAFRATWKTARTAMATLKLFFSVFTHIVFPFLLTPCFIRLRLTIYICSRGCTFECGLIIHISNHLLLFSYTITATKRHKSHNFHSHSCCMYCTLVLIGEGAALEIRCDELNFNTRKINSFNHTNLSKWTLSMHNIWSNGHSILSHLVPRVKIKQLFPFVIESNLTKNTYVRTDFKCVVEKTNNMEFVITTRKYSYGGHRSRRTFDH